jgi:hypothetical protein
MIKMTDITDQLNDKVIEKLPRHYLGLSSIGSKCYRKLQHDHYWTYKNKISARVQRLFNVGHSTEQVIIDDLAEVGIYVKGQQQEFIGYAGHWKGHCDGSAISEFDIGRTFLVEFKTHNDKNYAALVKAGVKAAFPGHYAQMMSYMGYGKYDYGLYVGYNKNDSYYHMEIITFDEDFFHELQRKEKEVVQSPELLLKIGNGKETWFECKLCSASSVCHGKTPVERNCRTCQYVDVKDDGMWFCSKTDSELDYYDQVAGCDLYTLGDMFR